jgi:hypothetical protein
MRRIPWGEAGFALGLVSLFIALGGPAWAGNLIDGHRLTRGSVTNAKLAKNSVTTSKIAAGAVTSSDVRDGTLRAPDLHDGAIVTSKLADDAVTGPKIANDSVESAEVRDGTLTADDLAPDSVTSAKVADGSLGSSDLGPNALRGNSLHASGATLINFPTIAAHTCGLKLVAATAVLMSNDVVWATPDAFFAGNFAYSVKTEGAQTAYVKMCNVSNTDADPDGAGGGVWRWAALQL